MERLKVVVTGTRGIPDIMGGVETHCEELYPRLVEMGYDVTVIRRSGYVREEVPRKAWKGVRLVDVPAPKSKRFEAIVHTWRAINMAKKLGADILHIHTIGPCLLAPYARMRGLKVVMTHHGPDYDRDKWGRAAKMMLRLGEYLGCRYAHHVIVISDVIKRLIAEKHRRTHAVSLIYNGVSAPEVCSCPEYFDELCIREGEYILGMCRFVPEKNLHHLIEAYSLIKDKLPHGFRLVLAGDTDFEDSYSRKLKEQARESGVVLTGFVKGRALHSLLSHAACYVLPSNHEGLPIALLEAMSYGVPVIASDIPANAEVRLPSSCYFPCGDVAALSQSIYRVVHEGVRRREYDMARYDWSHIASHVASVYDSTVEERTETLRVLNTDILAIHEQELLERLNEGMLVTPNLDHLVKLQKDREFYECYKQADWVICDSKVLWLSSKVLRRAFPETISGSSFFAHFYEYHRHDEACRIFLLGAMNDVARVAREKINAKVGRDIVVGACSPSYGFEKNVEENEEICRKIEESGATVVVVGVGAPKQEKWILAHRDKLPGVRIWMALGATIDFEAGSKKRAPRFFQKYALEWFYRLCLEPRRMFRRYMVDDIKFFWYLLKQKTGHYRDPFR